MSVILKATIKGKGKSAHVIADKLLEESDLLIKRDIRYCDRLSGVLELVLQLNMLGPVSINRRNVMDLYIEICEDERYHSDWSNEVVDAVLLDLFKGEQV